VAVAWAFLDAEGEERGRSDPFPDRQAAEDWMAAVWEDLLARGYAQAALVDLDRDRRLYRMGLGPA
jgi:hypothetical protein